MCVCYIHTEVSGAEIGGDLGDRLITLFIACRSFSNSYSGEKMILIIVFVPSHLGFEYMTSKDRKMEMLLIFEIYNQEICLVAY